MDWPSVVGGIFSGAPGAILNAQSVADTNRSNRSMVQMQNYQNLQQWKRENAYNHPVNQVQRLKAAGLNPGLLYGQPPTNTSAPSPTMQSSRDVPANFGNIDMLSAARTMAEIKNIDANTNKQNEEAKTEASLRQSRLDNLNAATANLLKQNEDIASKIQQRIHENKLTDAQVKQLGFERLMERKRFGLDFQRLQNETKMTDAQVSKLSADTQKALAEAKVTNREYDEMIWTFAMRKAGLASQVNLTNAQIEQANATARKLGFEADTIEGMASQKKFEAEAMRGEHGVGNQIVATTKYAIQEVIHDAGGVVGIFK